MSSSNCRFLTCIQVYVWFIYLAVPGLGCGMLDLQSSLQLQSLGSLVVTCGIIFLVAAWELLLWYVGSSSLTGDRTPGSLHWEHGVLATGPPEKSWLMCKFLKLVYCSKSFYGSTSLNCGINLGLALLTDWPTFHIHYAFVSLFIFLPHLLTAGWICLWKLI